MHRAQNSLQTATPTLRYLPCPPTILHLPLERGYKTRRLLRVTTVFAPESPSDNGAPRGPPRAHTLAYVAALEGGTPFPGATMIAQGTICDMSHIVGAQNKADDLGATIKHGAVLPPRKKR